MAPPPSWCVADVDGDDMAALPRMDAELQSDATCSYSRKASCSHSSAVHLEGGNIAGEVVMNRERERKADGVHNLSILSCTLTP